MRRRWNDPRVAHGFERPLGPAWKDREQGARGHQPDLRVLVIDEGQQCAALITFPALQFVADLVHLMVKPIVFARLRRESGLILCKRQSKKLPNKVIDCELVDWNTLVHFSTLNILSA